MKFKRRTEEEVEPRPVYAFCERVTATPMSRDHIRRVGAEGLKLGGGAPDTTLCGRPLSKGWDLQTPVTADLVRMRFTWTCPDCADAYLALGGSL